MSRPAKILQLVLFLIALAGIAYAVTGNFEIPSGDRAIWLHSGLLMIVLGAYWVESKFTRPDDVVINGLVAYISISTLGSPPYASWWTAFRYFSLILVIVAFTISWSGSPAIPRYDTSPLKRFAYLIVIRFGSARVLFSAVFVLALLSYVDLSKPATKWMVIFWGVVVAAKYLELDGLVTFVTRWKKPRGIAPVGEISRVFDPNVVRFRVLDGAACPRGRLVAFSSNGDLDENSPLGLVAGFRTSPDTVEAEAIVVDATFREGTLDKRPLVWEVAVDSPVVAPRLQRNIFLRHMSNFVGVAARGTEISRVYFELTRNCEALFSSYQWEAWRGNEHRIQ